MIRAMTGPVCVALMFVLIVFAIRWQEQREEKKHREYLTSLPNGQIYTSRGEHLEINLPDNYSVHFHDCFLRDTKHGLKCFIVLSVRKPQESTQEAHYELSGSGNPSWGDIDLKSKLGLSITIHLMRIDVGERWPRTEYKVTYE